MTAARGQGALRVAVVGAGPWGIYLAERLATGAGERRRRVEITLFDGGSAGRGPNFRSDLPDHHLLNFPLGHVEPWAVGQTVLPDALRSPVRWIRSTSGLDVPPDEPAPRSVVGAWFEAVLRALLHAAGPSASVRLVPRCVTDAEWSGDAGWSIHSADADHHRADELALVTGVAFASPPDAEARRFRHFADRHGLTWVDRWHDVRDAAFVAGRPVGVRGLGITFIDVALDLTEGRGGRFEAAGRGLRYVPSGREPRPILAFSRSGRLPAPKTRGPWPHRHEDPPRVFDDETADRLAGREGPLDFDRDVWPLLLAEMGADGDVDPVELAEAIATLPGSDDDPWHDRVLAGLRRDIDAASRGHDGTARTAVVEVWGRVFPDMIRAVSLGRLSAGSQRRFDEEIRPVWDALAFGPPLANARKIEALLADRWIDLSMARGGTVDVDDEGGEFVLHGDGGERTVAQLVDARIPRFDLDGGAPELYAALAERGYLTRFVNREGGEVYAPGGVAVDERAFAVPVPGRPRVPLAVVGAPTEGCVLGTDALPGTRSSWVEAWVEAVLAGDEASTTG